MRRTLFLLQSALLVVAVICLTWSSALEAAVDVHYPREGGGSDEEHQWKRNLQEQQTEPSETASWLVGGSGAVSTFLSGIWHTATSIFFCDDPPIPSPPTPMTPIPTRAPNSRPTRAPNSSPTRPTPPSGGGGGDDDDDDDGSFTIDLGFYGVGNSERYAFQYALQKWSRVITGDLPSLAATTSGSSGESVLSGSSYCGSWPRTIDDVYICGAYVSIDGPKGILGAAGPRHYRPSSGIPLTGEMKFDTADIFRGDFDHTSVILHEMGHVLGIGPMWRTVGLTNSYTPPCPYKMNSYASREFRRLSGCSSAAIPIEQSMGRGSNCGHWSEQCLGNEIMTPTADSTLPMSRLTIAALRDLGYQVNMGVAETYRTSEMNSYCRCRNNRQLLRNNNSTTIPSFLSTPIHNNHTTNRPLYHPDDDEEEILSSSSQSRRRNNQREHRQLSEEGRKIAVDFGKAMLEENRAAINLIPGDNNIPDLGSEVVYVLYEEEDGSIHSVMVTEELLV